MNAWKISRLFSLTIIFLLIISTLSCSAKSDGQLRFGIDADYFAGLKMLEEGNEKEARSKFNRCVKKGTYYCAKKSAEALCTFGSVQEKNLAAENLIAKFKDKDSLLIAVKQFESAGEITKIIENTQNLNFKEDKNELIKIRLNALKKLGSSSYEPEVYKWFTECPVSKVHYQFYMEDYDHPDFEAAYMDGSEEICIEYTPEQFALNFRIELYKRNYTYTLGVCPHLLEYLKSGGLSPSEQLASDIGKTYLYGSMDFAENGDTFTKLAQTFAGTPMEFYFWFYAGRLYDKAGNYYKKTKNSFEQAVTTAKNSDQKDNALWYLLDTSLNFSVDSIIEDIGSYAKDFGDPEYFDDLLEGLASPLLASGRWNDFKKIYTSTDGFACDEIVAQYAYIYGRLVQEGLAEGTFEDEQNAFKRALNSGSSDYYRIMAAYKLGLSGDELEKTLCMPINQKKDNKADGGNSDLDAGIAEAAKNLLEGYAYFGFPDLIYPVWNDGLKNVLPAETDFYLSEFLQKAATDDEDDDRYSQSLRIAAYGRKMAESRLTREQMNLLFPEDYSEYVNDYCKKYDIKPSVMYSLIRSESFFNADVTSSAGAVGLTQLMEFTAGDIARKTKLTDYSLTNPENSIQLGTYYLAELVRRCDGSLLQGFFSYNAGITRVRRWLQSSLIEFGSKGDMPQDLFLETVPYTETREYGRKLVSAAAMYQWLEDSDSFDDIMEELVTNQKER